MIQIRFELFQVLAFSSSAKTHQGRRQKMMIRVKLAAVACWHLRATTSDQRTVSLIDAEQLWSVILMLIVAEEPLLTWALVEQVQIPWSASQWQKGGLLEMVSMVTCARMVSTVDHDWEVLVFVFVATTGFFKIPSTPIGPLRQDTG